MKILIGLSGGVDSSVAALLLKQQGHEVIGVTMSIWGDRTISNTTFKSRNACFGPHEKEDIEEARNFCKQIGIDFLVFDCKKQYEEIVLNNFKEEYLKGRTPNPCVWCNAMMKFGVLVEFAKSQGLSFDKFATGHYARIKDDFLMKGIDKNKDQSYFLYRLKKEQLKNIILPLGEYKKEEIRNIAKKNNLKVADKIDSQDFFEGNYNELLNIQPKEGNIIDINNNILGKHQGFWNYTIGQRKGLKISSKEALYVIDIKKETNEVVVGFEKETFRDNLIAAKLNWLTFDNLEKEINCEAKIRSSQNMQRVLIKPIDKDNVEVQFENMQKSIAKGQSIVFYDDEIVLGGGIIDEVR